MAQTLTNIRISLRTDDEKNWVSNNPILNNGELAIVKMASNNIKIKVGDGIQKFNELQYLNDNLIETNLLSAVEISATSLSARCISQGYNTKSSPTSLATGILAEAEANFGVVHGIEAKIKKGDDYAFVFNGTNLQGIADRYTSHGEGTFSINPLSGLSGFYVGEQTLADLLDSSREDALEEVVPAIFRNVQLVKPIQPEGHHLHLRCDIARDDQFEDMVAAGIDTANGSNFQLVKYFVQDGVSGIWETMTSAGLYTDADDVPASFYFADALSAIDETPKISSQYFLRYFWYYQLGGVEHKSDQFSIAIPSNTAVGANPGDVIHRGEFYDLKQTVQPLKQTTSKETEYNRYYICKPMVISEITSSLTGSFDVLLDDYEASQIYRMQFTVGSSDATPRFFVDYGNGPELAKELKVNQDSYTFKAEKSYYTELQGDVLRVDTLGYSPSSDGGGGSSGPYRYPLVTAELSVVGGSLCCLIEDHTVTTIEVSSAATPLVVKLPPKPVDNRARDFILRIEVSSSTAPGVTFAGLDESITFDSDSEDWMAIEPGLNLISFTETK